MKNLKLVFLAAILCGSALSVNAQSVTYDYSRNWDFYVNCDGVWDVISGPVHIHGVDHYNPVTGMLDWYKFVFQSQELVSWVSNEVFSVNFYIKGDVDGYGPLTIHYNLVGNQGSHYLVTTIFTYDPETGALASFTKTVKCL